MKLKYYGTAAGFGIPEIFCDCRVCHHAREAKEKNIRTRSCAILDNRLAIDLSVDTFGHSAFAGLDMRNIHHVLVTHGHHDHFFPTDLFTRARNMTEPVKIYISQASGKEVSQTVDRVRKEIEVGKRDPNASTKAEIKTLEFYKPVRILDYTVTPLRARHAEALEAMIFVIQADGKNILWAHDTGKFQPDAVEWLQASGLVFDLVSLDCTLKRGTPISKSHMDPDQCIEMANLLRDNRNANEKTQFVLSHISHLVERTHEELEREAAEAGMVVAYDGMELEF